MKDIRLTFIVLFFGIAFGAMTISGCTCKETAAEQENGTTVGCQSDEECQLEYSDSRYYCQDGECILGRRYCEEEGDVQCCPGQSCSRDGLCMDRYVACNADDDCNVAGQVCRPRFVNNIDQDVCTFDPCTNGTCGDDLYCFADFCVGENPCNGGCPSGQACVLSNNRCHPAPTCDETCSPGAILVFGDPDNVDENCDLDSLFCICEALRPLHVIDTGRYSDIAALPNGTLAVSAYNGDYGDLVVLYFDPGSGSLALRSDNLNNADWVDGIPANAPTVANPTGPRYGKDDPGPDVGRYTSIVSDSSGTLHISYYDKSERRLKYARGGNGKWTNHVVDEGGDVGLYSDIGISEDGTPVIAYFQGTGPDDDRLLTGLKIAEATTNAPSSSSDWNVVFADSAHRPAVPCEGECPSRQRCIEDAEGTSCYPTLANEECEPECGGNQVCVDIGSGPACHESLNMTMLHGIPKGTGLFPSLVLDNNQISVAYYDQITKSLRLVTNVSPKESESGTVHVLHSDPRSDIGKYPSAAADDSSNIMIAYQAGKELLWLLADTNGAILESGIIDDGIRDPRGDSIRLVGIDNNIFLTPDSERATVYQDVTTGTLMLAIQKGDSWEKTVLTASGATGFYASSVVSNRVLYTSHATIKSRNRAPLQTTLQVEKFEF